MDFRKSHFGDILGLANKTIFRFEGRKKEDAADSNLNAAGGTPLALPEAPVMTSERMNGVLLAGPANVCPRTTALLAVKCTQGT